MSVLLSELLKSTSVLYSGANESLAVSKLACDSRKVTPGTLFFGLQGTKTNGLEFAAQAAAEGAVAIVSDAAQAACALPLIQVPNAHAAMGEMAAAFYGRPSDTMKTMGVTGTNGKTTTAFLVKHLLDEAQKRCGLIGTIKYSLGNRDLDASRTTPDSLELHALLAQMRDNGCKAVAMEVSSHALVQHRCAGVEFDAAAFTNLTQDHLDYHGTMEKYFEAKALFFERLGKQTRKKGRAIINIEDRYGRMLFDRYAKNLRVITYGRGVNCDFRATEVRYDATGSTFHLAAKGRSYLVRLPFIGAFNIYNTLAALASASAMGMELRAAVAAMAVAPQVPGRLERVAVKRNFQVFVDYAHTDDALRNVLRTLKDLRPNRLIAVFGCGGDRDKAKRPLMAAAGEELADWSILTSDNPRSEDPERILAEMKRGLRANRHELIVDREEAIRRAVDLAQPGDIVLIAGKGHEKYQEFAGEKRPFDDVARARRAIEAKPVGMEG